MKKLNIYNNVHCEVIKIKTRQLHIIGTFKIQKYKRLHIFLKFVMFLTSLRKKNQIKSKRYDFKIILKRKFPAFQSYKNVSVKFVFFFLVILQVITTFYDPFV